MLAIDRFAIGHSLVFGMHSALAPAAVVYIAFFRDPMQRIVSQYWYEVKRNIHNSAALTFGDWMERRAIFTCRDQWMWSTQVNPP